MLRQASLGEEDCESKLETSHRNPVGNHSHPVRASHPPEASLASSSVMAARSVDSECKSRVIEPRNKAKSQGAFVVIGPGAMSTHCIGLVESILPGSKSRANAHRGSLGTWEIPSISAPIAGRDIRLTKSQARGRGFWHPRERNPRVQERYRHATATERVGWTREVLASS
jgi:hypothetical protein